MGLHFALGGVRVCVIREDFARCLHLEFAVGALLNNAAVKV